MAGMVQTSALTGVAVGVEGRDGVGEKRLLGLAQAKIGQSPTEPPQTGRETFFVPAIPAGTSAFGPLPLKLGCRHEPIHVLVLIRPT